MLRASFVLFCLVLMVVLSNCSTVLNTTSQDVFVNSDPENAKIIIDGKKFGTTPQTVNLERGSTHVIKFELDGYESYETQVTKKISFWFWMNAFNGFVPGMLIDMFTGSMYNLLPTKLEVTLTPAKADQPKKTK